MSPSRRAGPSASRSSATVRTVLMRGSRVELVSHRFRSSSLRIPARLKAGDASCFESISSYLDDGLWLMIQPFCGLWEANEAACATSHCQPSRAGPTRRAANQVGRAGSRSTWESTSQFVRLAAQPKDCLGARPPAPSSSSYGPGRAYPRCGAYRRTRDTPSPGLPSTRRGYNLSPACPAFMGDFSYTAMLLR